MAEPESDALTVADSPLAARRGAGSGSGSGTAGSKLATGVYSQQALHVDEVSRARGMGLLLGSMCITCSGAFPFLGGVPWLRTIAITAVSILGVISFLVWWRARPGDGYRTWFRVFISSAVIASGFVEYYIGIFSPAPIAVLLGISFFGTCADRRFAVAGCTAAALIYSTTALLIGTDVIPDLGLIQKPTSQIMIGFAIVMVPFVFFGTLRQASLSRRAAIAAVAQVETAVREVQQRDAQLAEANQDLEKALEAGAGKGGRHSGAKAGAWVLGQLIGRGAMGEVYAALHENGFTTAAVKTLAASDDADQLARFRREADIASKLRAPGLVSVFEVGELPGRVPYIVMELLSGHDLSWHLRKLQRLPIADAIALCEQVGAGLRDAHAAGIVHRDIKPQNLFLHEPPGGGPPSWKILDFGVSKLSDGQGTLTQNLVIGTPGYMAPEQARGQAADARSDLFAFGAVMYRALTGQAPFRGNDTPQILFDVVYRGPRRPTELARDLPGDVDLALAIALAKRADARFATADELVAAMRAGARGKLSAELRARGEIALIELPWGGRAPREQD
jgi:serine/threonine-protein kinase